MKSPEMFYVQANFPDEGWRSVFDVPYKKEMAEASLEEAKRANPELDFRLLKADD